MHARIVRKDEFEKTDALFSIAFNSPQEVRDEKEEEKTEEKTNEEEEEELRIASFDEDDTTMMSCIYLPSYDVTFDGNTVKMVGVGGVATPPQYRRNGGIRACFTVGLPEVYKRGFLFSYLYPFSTAYYRKFGFEIGAEQMQYKLMLNFLPDFKVKGKCVMVDMSNVEKSQKEIKGIYDYFTKQYNMMVVDGEDKQGWVKESDPIHSLNYTFIYKDEKGEAQGFMRMKTILTPGDRHLFVRRIFFKTAEALKGLINILKSYAADFSYAEVWTAEKLNLEYVLPEWSFGAITRCAWADGMVRVVNVKEVLKCAKYRNSGEFTVKITDEYIPENDKAFYVKYENGKALEVKEVEESALKKTKAFASMRINEFSRLILGVRVLSDLTLIEDIEFSSIEDFDNVFFYKKAYITEDF